jgi:chorismate mutase / prephenate dehydratase
MTIDRTVAGAREAIDAVDRELLQAMNRRIELVRALHEHKVANGIPLHDTGREESLLSALRGANGGPLSDDGVDELFAFVLDLTRKEVHGE